MCGRSVSACQPEPPREGSRSSKTEIPFFGMTKRPLRAALSLDREAFARDRRSLGKSELQHTVVEVGFGALLRYFGGQFERAGVARSEPFRVQNTIAILLFFFT